MDSINFAHDFLDVNVMLTDAVLRYVRLHADPRTAATHPPVTRISFDTYLGEVPNAGLNFDTVPGSYFGDETHSGFAEISFPHWWPVLERHDAGKEIEVRRVNGSVRLVSVAKFDQTFHGFFADALLAARAAGTFDPLPKAPLCELNVMCGECGYEWPDGYDRGLENLADPREPGRRLAKEPEPSAEQRVADDRNAYDVWARSGKASDAAAVVAVNGVLGIGLPAARKVLSGGQPIARDVTAAEVRRLARPLRRAGLDVVVDPEFRWPID